MEVSETCVLRRLMEQVQERGDAMRALVRHFDRPKGRQNAIYLTRVNYHHMLVTCRLNAPKDGLSR